MEHQFNVKKQWSLPVPTGNNVLKPSFRKVSQVKFFNEYFPSGHKIYDGSWYEDITIMDDNGRYRGTHFVNRISMPIQAMSIDIILAHLLGNKTHLVDSTLKENESLPVYKEFWENKNLDTARYELIKSALALGDGAILFYKGKDGLMWKLLSLFNDDYFHMEYDKYGEPIKFFRYYENYCDVYEEETVSTYTNENGVWELISGEDAIQHHGFKGIPVVYKKRESGAFWSPVQSNIENAEKMLSRLSEDNRSKFKSLYHLKTDNPNSVQNVTAGMTDMIVTDTDGDFKLVPSSSLSQQFEFEYTTQMELIFNSLGIVFPKHKSSGDMPTGSMRLMFYPSERVIMPLIHEFNQTLDEINEIAKQAFVAENPSRQSDIVKGNIRASIDRYTPEEDATINSSVVELYKAGVISGETASEQCTYASNNEETRKESERKRKIEHERELMNLRLPFDDF